LIKIAYFKKINTTYQVLGYQISHLFDIKTLRMVRC